jgi:signal transduction histidine kinase
MKHFFRRALTFKFLATCVACFVTVMGGINLYGWLFGDMADKGVKVITMKTNAAFSLWCLGLSLFLLAEFPRKKSLLKIVYVLSGTVFVVAVLTFFENVFGWDFGIDQLLIKEPVGALGVVNPNRMGIPASVSFTLSSIALMWVVSHHRPAYIAQFFGWVVSLIGLFSVIGYLYQVKPMFSLAKYTAIAFPTALSIFLLGIGILLVRSREGLMQVFTVTETGRTLLGKLLFPCVGLALATGYVILNVERAGLYDSATSTGILTVAFIVFFTWILYRNATELNEKVASQRRAQKALEQKQAELNEAQRIAHIGSWSLDAKTMGVTASPEVFLIQGLDPTKPYPSFREENRGFYTLTPACWDKVNELVNRALKTGEGYEIDLESTHADGRSIWFTARGEAIRDVDGTIIGLRGTVQDITRRKQATDELKKTNEQLKNLTANLEKRVAERTQQLEEQTIRLRQLALELTETEQSERKRLAQMLHDHLQQLLVAALLRLDLLLRKNPGPEKEAIKDTRGFIDQAIQASRSLTAELRPPVLYEGGLVAALGFLVRKMDHQYKIHVRLSMSADVEPQSDATKAMIYQSVQELLFNAAKYSGVDECFLHLERPANQKNIMITIRDYGRGFDVAKIGEHMTGGFGLFSIRERINALGGTFRVESSPGNGVIFELSVPDNRNVLIEEGKDGQETAASGGSTRGKGTLTILLADDHKIVRQSLSKLLSAQEFVKEIIEAEDGMDAVRKAKEFKPDIVVMDLNMPKMNGIEATKILHEYDPRLKIIGLSVQVELEMANAMKKAGAVAYFNKAEDASGLIEAIRGFSNLNPKH